MTDRNPSHRRTTAGFTLIELQVVIAIIAILIALLVPAAQKIREAAARTQCQNNLRQWALAMHNHHDNKSALPAACQAVGTNRQSWVPQLWPFIEQDDLHRLYDFNVGFYLPPNTIVNTLNGPTGVALPTYYCPSDRGKGALAQGDQYWRVRGNYVPNWGPVVYQTQPSQPVPSVWAPFGFEDFFSRERPRRSQMTDFSDGTSNTLLMSEVIIHFRNDHFDHRGDILNDDGVNVFMTLDTPNSGIDALKFPQYCDTLPGTLPCTTATGASSRFAIRLSARSKHPGGVNVALSDGSVRFVGNAVPLGTWQALSTLNGGEVPDASSF